MAGGASDGSGRARGRLAVAGAALAWSSAGIVQRSLTVDAQTQIVGRAAFAFLGILLFVAATERGGIVRSFRRLGRVGLAFALAIAVSSGTFLAALNATTVANVLVFQAAAPLVAAILGRFLLDERVSGRTWVATFVALGGVAIMVGGPGGGLSIGLVLAAIMSLSFAASVVLARLRTDVSMAPASCLAQVLLVVCLGPLAHPAQVDPHDLVLLAALGIGQIGLGLVLLTIGARLVPAAEVALITQLEVILGPLWVWLARGETPSTATLIGGAVILGAVVLGTVTSRRGRPALDEDDLRAYVAAREG